MGSDISHPNIVFQTTPSKPTEKISRGPDDDHLIKLWANMHAECATVSTPDQREKCRHASTLAYTAALDTLIEVANNLN